MKAFDDELTSGHVFRSVWKLAWPVTLLNLVNGVHGLVDHILVGHFVVDEMKSANAAIGIAWQVFLVLVVFIASLFHGSNVLVARYAGRQDRERMSLVAYETFLASVIMLVFVIAPIGYFLSPKMLDFVHAEEHVREYALIYLRILFTCGAPLFLMFMITGAFQASGDAKTPLKLGVLTTVLNVVISSILIVVFKMGVVGAALGTVFAPLVTVMIALSLVFRKKMILQPPTRFHLLPDLRVLKVVVRIGVPTGVQGVLLNIGGVLLLRYIGKLPSSAAAQAAYTICYSQLFSLVTWTSFGLRAAASTLTGQNLGAGKPERARTCVHLAAALGAVWASVIGVIFWFFPAQLLGLFDAAHGQVLTFGTSLLRTLSFSGFFLATALAFTGGLQGAGETKMPMYIAFLTQIVILLGICQGLVWMNALTAQRLWLAILVCHFARHVMTHAVFRRGKWVHIKVELEH